MKKLSLLVILTLLLAAALEGETVYKLTVTVSGGTGGIIVTPASLPGQIIRSSGFFLFKEGTAVNMEATYDPAFSSYCPLQVAGHQWSGAWTGDPADMSGTVIMDGDRNVGITFNAIAPPCPAPIVTMNITPRYTTIRSGKSFSTDISFSAASSQLISGYELILTYSPGVLALDTSRGNQGIEGAANVVFPEPGEIRITEDNVSIYSRAFKAYWITSGEGESSLALSGQFHTSASGVLQFPGSGVALSPGLVRVSNLPGVGDANYDQAVNIVDALIAAQYSVGLLSAPLNGVQADVNQDRNVDIIDALQIAQFYVGLIELNGIR